MNLRPSGYEPDELPGCSTPRHLRRRADRPAILVLAGLAGGARSLRGGGIEEIVIVKRGGLEDLATTYSPVP